MRRYYEPKATSVARWLDEIRLPVEVATEDDMERWTRIIGTLGYEKNALSRRGLLENRMLTSHRSKVEFAILPYVREFLKRRKGIANSYSCPWGRMCILPTPACDHSDLRAAICRHAHELGPDELGKYILFRRTGAPLLTKVLRDMGATLPSYHISDRIHVNNTLPPTDEFYSPWEIDEDDGE